VEVFTRLSNEDAARRGLADVGEIETDLGNFERAQELLEESLRRAEELAATSHAASILHSLGDLALEMGNANLAGRRYREGLALVREHAPGATTCYCLAGLAAATADRADAAGVFWGAAQRLERELGFRIPASHRNRYEARLRAAGVPTDAAPVEPNAVDAAAAVALALSLD